MQNFTEEQKFKLVIEAIRQADDPTRDVSVMEALVNIKRAFRDKSPEMRLLDDDTLPISCVITNVVHEESSNRDVIRFHAFNAKEGSQIEEIRTYRLESELGRLQSSRAKSLIQQRAVIWKVKDPIKGDQLGKSVRIAIWVEKG